MRSRFNGICGECKQPYVTGDMIWYERSNYCMCDSCGNRYAANYNTQQQLKQQQLAATTTTAAAVTPTPYSPPPESREQAIERMHGENVAAVKAQTTQLVLSVEQIVAKLQMVAEQIGLLADKQQKRNELLYEKGAK